MAEEQYLEAEVFWFPTMDDKERELRRDEPQRLTNAEIDGEIMGLLPPHRDSLRTGLEAGIKLGHRLLVRSERENLQQGPWGPWLRPHYDLPPESAHDYVTDSSMGKACLTD